MQESIAAHGDRYLTRVFTSGELSDCGGAANPDPARLAARVAAKEAAFKALRVDQHPIAWTDVEVRRDASGCPQLLLSGRAATLADQEGVFGLSLSLTHLKGKTTAAAVVITEIR